MLILCSEYQTISLQKVALVARIAEPSLGSVENTTCIIPPHSEEKLIDGQLEGIYQGALPLSSPGPID